MAQQGVGPETFLYLLGVVRMAQQGWVRTLPILTSTGSLPPKVLVPTEFLHSRGGLEHLLYTLLQPEIQIAGWYLNFLCLWLHLFPCNFLLVVKNIIIWGFLHVLWWLVTFGKYWNNFCRYYLCLLVLINICIVSCCSFLLCRVYLQNSGQVQFHYLLTNSCILQIFPSMLN